MAVTTWQGAGQEDFEHCSSLTRHPPRRQGRMRRPRLVRRCHASRSGAALVVRQPDPHDGSRVGTLDPAPSSRHGGPVVHVHQPSVPRRRGRDVEADAVVLHDELHAVGPGPDGHHDLRGPGVLACVDQGFLHDPESLPAVALAAARVCADRARSRRRRPSAAWSVRRCAARRPRRSSARDASRSPVSSSNSSSRSPCVTESSTWCSWSNSGETAVRSPAPAPPRVAPTVRAEVRRQRASARTRRGRPPRSVPFCLLRVDQSAGEKAALPGHVLQRRRAVEDVEGVGDVLGRSLEQAPHLVIESLRAPGVDRERADHAPRRRSGSTAVASTP